MWWEDFALLEDEKIRTKRHGSEAETKKPGPESARAYVFYPLV
jgi:hypothetical protein